ncbi:MAG: hypothetical protein JWQ04_3323 [Pedosphaera sp.]|nr:hypothetical protein [Pedosphaera sp.]
MIINSASSALSLQTPQKATAKSAAQSAGNQTQTDSLADQLAVSAENLDAATPMINDSTTALQSLESARRGILSQSNQALMAHSNLIPESVLQLLEA